MALAPSKLARCCRGGVAAVAMPSIGFVVVPAARPCWRDGVTLQEPAAGQCHMADAAATTGRQHQMRLVVVGAGAGDVVASPKGIMHVLAAWRLCRGLASTSSHYYVQFQHVQYSTRDSSMWYHAHTAVTALRAVHGHPVFPPRCRRHLSRRGH